MTAMLAQSPVSSASSRSSARTWNPAAIKTLTARPSAANGVSNGNIPVAIGSTRPIAPKNSMTPMNTTSARGRSEKPVHRSMPRPRIFGALAARKKSARKTWTDHSTPFTTPKVDMRDSLIALQFGQRLELVRVADRVNGVNASIPDVEYQRRERSAAHIHDETRLSIDSRLPHASLDRHEALNDADDESRYRLRPGDRPQRGSADLATAIRPERDVLGKHA